jgi:hypothetical protein
MDEGIMFVLGATMGSLAMLMVILRIIIRLHEGQERWRH